MSEFELDDKITIRKTERCDTRTLKPGEKISIDNVLADTLAHQQAVALAMGYFAKMAQEQAKKHDWSKTGSAEHHDKDFIGWFTEALNDRAFYHDEGKDPTTWWGYHVANERHHLDNAVPKDVNLIDVMEMLCDCVCAGMARTGNVYPIKIAPEVLEKAVENTVEILKRHIVVSEDENKGENQ